MKKNKVILSIVVSSFSSLVITEHAVALEPTKKPAKVIKTKHTSGKCASGKCGTEKIYGKANINYDPQDKRAFARDGKCGAAGFGLETTEQEMATKVIGGVCGQ